MFRERRGGAMCRVECSVSMFSVHILTALYCVYRLLIGRGAPPAAAGRGSPAGRWAALSARSCTNGEYSGSTDTPSLGLALRVVLSRVPTLVPPICHSPLSPCPDVPTAPRRRGPPTARSVHLSTARPSDRRVDWSVVLTAASLTEHKGRN